MSKKKFQINLLDNGRKSSKTFLSKSHSTNSEDKPSSNCLIISKKDSLVKKMKNVTQKLINTVDWEEDVSSSKKEKEMNSSEIKKLETLTKASDETKNSQQEQEHMNFNNAINNILHCDTVILYENDKKNEAKNEQIEKNNEENIDENKGEKNEAKNYENQVENKDEINDEKKEKDSARNSDKSNPILDEKQKEVKFEEDFAKGNDLKSMNESTDLPNEEREKELDVNSKKPSPSEQILNNSNERIKPFEIDHTSPDVSQKVFVEINEKKTFSKTPDDRNFYNKLNGCNDIEMKIIKNMLNETNQRSRFSFVHSEEKNNEEKRDNSLKEILLSSLKLNEFKRSCSLNFNEIFDKNESIEKKDHCYSHFNDGNILGVNLLNIFSNREQMVQNEFMVIHENN